MNSTWVYNVPCSKNLIALNEFYLDYENLKIYLFDLLKKTGVFNNIGPNKKILLKPNWVFHQTRKNDELCLTTNPNFILVVLEFILQFEPSSVIIGDSPLQSCIWELMHQDSFMAKINKLEKYNNTTIKVVDFRNEKWVQKLSVQKNCRNKGDFVLFDLKTDSLLEPLSYQEKKFIVGDYNPQETAKNHSKGTHKYLVAKEAIDADIVINLPKLKTHQKAGVTNGLKNYVGTIGEKGYLAHHSSNLSISGGDCFPGNNIIRKTSEYFSELSFKYRGEFLYFPLHYFSSILWRLAPRSIYASFTGSWYGNDTVWRMALDINKIINYGNINGEISNKIQREIITINDAIISGQGEGPLKPVPLPLGMVAISDNDGLLDMVMARLYSFDYKKIPILKYLSGEFNKHNVHLFLDDKEIDIYELDKFAVQAIPPKGWRNFIEL